MIKVVILLNLLKEKAREGVNVYLSVDLLNDLSFERKMKRITGKWCTFYI